MQQQKSTINPRRITKVPLSQFLMPGTPIMLNQYPEFAWWCSALQGVDYGLRHALAYHPYGEEFPKLVELEFTVKNLFGCFLNLPA